MLGHGCPTLVIDAAVAEHLKILRFMAFGGAGIIEGVQHADAFHRLLLDAVDDGRARVSRLLPERSA